MEAALDHLELAPPPRTLVIDVGDQGGLRIRMSATGNGLQLDVTTDDGSSAAAWEQDLREHLAQRGFDLGGERSPRNAVEEQDEMTDNPRRPRPDGAIRL